MTDAEIDALPAGPELDALIAERVMKLTRLPDGRWALRTRATDGETVTILVGFPEYSNSDAAALAILGHLRKEEFQARRYESDDRWEVHFTAPVRPDRPSLIFHGFGETLALASCRAALKAVQA